MMFPQILSVRDDDLPPADSVSIMAIGHTSEHPHVAQARALSGRLKVTNAHMIKAAIILAIDFVFEMVFGFVFEMVFGRDKRSAPIKFVSRIRCV